MVSAQPINLSWYPASLKAANFASAICLTTSIALKFLSKDSSVSRTSTVKSKSIDFRSSFLRGDLDPNMMGIDFNFCWTIIKHSLFLSDRPNDLGASIFFPIRHEPHLLHLSLATYNAR